MSPDPVTANVPPACWYPPRRSAGALLTAPIDRPAHWPPRAGAPRRRPAGGRAPGGLQADVVEPPGGQGRAALRAGLDDPQAGGL